MPVNTQMKHIITKPKALSLSVMLIFFLSIINAPLALAKQYDLKYDATGNLIEGLNHNYEYDSFNQLKLVREKETGEVIEEYWYDHEGNRIKKVHYNEDGSEEAFYYIGNGFVRKINDTATTDTNYYYLGSELVAKKENGQMLFFHPDNLGSTSLITDESGNAVEKTAYLPFGEVEEGGMQEIRLYTGKELDKTGLAYYGARYYSPFTKQFTQPDTILPDIYDPQQLNRYAYARNNPYKYTDPTGHCPFCLVAVGIGYGVIALSYFISSIIVPALAEFPHITIPWAMANIEEYGTGKGLAVTGAEMAGGEVAGKLIGKAAGAAFKWAKNAISSLTRKSVSDAFNSPSAMMESKAGPLGAPAKTATQAFRQFEGKDVPFPKYPTGNDKHIFQGHHDLHFEPENSKFLPGEGGQKFADKVYSKGNIQLSKYYPDRYVIDADLGRIVGTRGETGGRIIIDAGTGKVITQFPRRGR